MLARWSRYELLVIDEVGYVPMADVGAELLFQVIAERAEKAVVILTRNLPFSEWTQVIPNARLCEVLLDRITDRAHIIETGTESYRFRRTMQRKRKSYGVGHAAAGLDSGFRCALNAPPYGLRRASLQPEPKPGGRKNRKEQTNHRINHLGGANSKFRKGPKQVAKSTNISRPA